MIRLTLIIISICIISNAVLANVTNDTIPPTILSPAVDSTINCSGVNSLTALEEWYNRGAGLTAMDNIDSAITVIAEPTLNTAQISFNNSDGCGTTKFVDVIFYAVDSCGNRSLPSPARFSSIDTRGPTIIEGVRNKPIFCSAGIQDTLANWMARQGDARAIDDCGEVSWERFAYTDNLGNSGNGVLGEDLIPIPDGICTWRATVSFIVVDECGNQGVTTGFFSIVDLQPPVFTSSVRDTTLSCIDASLISNIEAMDICTADPIISVSDSTNREGTINDCSFYNYTIFRDIIATDNCGNSTSTRQIITVVDNQAPTFELMDTVNITCEELNDPTAEFNPSDVIDDCSNVRISIQDTTIGEGCSYSVRRTYTFSDVCGNSVEAIQIINITDNDPPILSDTIANMIFDCTESISENSFAFYLENFGNITASDDCGEVTSFASVPGSYDINDPTTFPGTLPILDDLSCGNNVQGFLMYNEVDFVFVDNCGNTSVAKGVFGIRDTISPIIQGCPEDTTIETDSFSCNGLLTLENLEISDDCIELGSMVSRSQTVQVLSSDPGNSEVPVNIVNILLGPYPTNFLSVAGDGQLTISINQGDIDETDEYFTIFSELADSLGITSLSQVQCGNSEVTINLSQSEITQWLRDGTVRVILSNSNASINDICGNTTVTATLTFPNGNFSEVTKSILIDDALLAEGNSSEINSLMVPVGTHTVTQIITDCAGNKDACSYEVTVEDNIPPTITCPDTISIIADGDSCVLNVGLSLPIQVEDNCNLNLLYDQFQPGSDSVSFIQFNRSDENLPFEAENLSFTFENIFPVFNNSKAAQLEVTIHADINDQNELFEIRGENNISIGFLGSIDLGECQTIRRTFPINIDDINNWGSDGMVEINLLSLTSEDAINPCSDITIAGIDRESFVQVRLVYSDATFQYRIAGDTVTQELPRSVDSLNLALGSGESELILFASDAAGNQDSCSVFINVRDGINPSAICQQAVIFLDPSGVQPYILTPQEIDGGSSDNCAIDSMVVSPSEFTCAFLDDQIPVTLYVFDGSGNVDSCTTDVMVRTPILEPSFDLGVCNSDTLQLFANVPPTNVPNAYSFSWEGPSGFSSLAENPMIPNVSANNNGTYTLTVTGFNGCISSGTIDVNLEELSSPNLEADKTEICIGDNVLLTTMGRSGNVSYQWFEGTFPNGLLIETTEAPSLLVAPSQGDRLYYVIVEKDGCASNPSPSQRISVVEAPQVSVAEQFISVCEGDPLILKSTTEGDNLNYQWSGPNNFSSDQESPDTIQNIAMEDGGTYSLFVTQGDCRSDTVSILVTVFQKPITPIIVSGDVFCEGTTVSLSVNNIPNADLYTWFRDGEERTSTAENTLTLSNADINLSGNWTVIVTEGFCLSDMSSPKEIIIESELLISANNNGPGCIGDSVELSSSFVPDATYNWTGPDGFTSNIQNPIIPALSGTYSVNITTPSGCDGEASTVVEVISPPEITALSSNALECMNGDRDITFTPSIFPQGDYEYEWTGPNGYTADSLNAVVPNATSADNGIYQLVLISGTCRSQPRTLDIMVTTVPDIPIINGQLNYCEGDTLILRADNVMNVTRYIWTTPQGQLFTEDSILIITEIQEEDSGNYAVSIEAGNCRSNSSMAVEVTIGGNIFQPVIESNSPVCIGDTLTFEATFINNVTYLWSGPNSFSSNLRNPIIPNVTEEAEGVYELTISSGVCEINAQPLAVSIESAGPPPLIESEDIEVCENLLENLEFCVENGEVGINTTFNLYNSIDDALLMSGSGPCIVLSDLSFLEEGDNFFYFRKVINNCLSERSAPITVNLKSTPIIDPELVENDITICENEEITLTSLFGPPEVSVNWTSLTGGLILSSNTGQAINASGFIPGINRILFSYSDPLCGSLGEDTARIILSETPFLQNDQIRLEDFNPINIPVFNNDQFGNNVSIRIVENPNAGNVTINENGIQFTPDPRFIGNVSMIYEVCNLNCNDGCATAQVVINIGNAGDCTTPTIITPNGDNYNDAFVVPCLGSGDFPDNQLIIFNQWGTTVYEASNYSNDWEGTHDGEPLPVGTYFYILKLGDGSPQIIGFLVIER